MLRSRRGALGRVALPLQHGVSLAWAWVLLSLLCVGLCHQLMGTEGPGLKVVAAVGKCIEREREALLAVRDGIWYDLDYPPFFSSWEKSGDDCCLWEGVGCDGRSGRVLKLDLRGPPRPSVDAGSLYFYIYLETTSFSTVSPSLLNLTSLRHLDLSNNIFAGAPIPNFVGSLVNLEYLNLSHAFFEGAVPPQLGGLRRLRSLDLSGNHLSVEDLRWLTHLSLLQYLDMSSVDLSAATDWLQVINSLPSLSVVRLSHCELQNLPTTVLPHVNLTSLSTLDLSLNFYHNSTWPRWLFNVTSLIELDLSDNGLRGPIPDEFGKMKHLEVLKLSGNIFGGTVTPPSFLMLDKLKLLRLSGIRLPEHLGELSNLRELELMDVIGRIPESLGNLSRLESLSMQGYNSSGESLMSLGNLGNLKRLDLFLDNFHGRIPESLGNLSRLESLSITSYGVIIPESVGNMVNLKDLILSSDTTSGGGIPKSLGNLRGLKTLRVSGFNVSQELLRNMGHLCNLTRLEMFANMGLGAEVNELFQGLSQCTKGSSLENLYLGYNRFGGHLPDQVGKLSNVRYLDLSGNSIVGSIPASIGELSNLRYLDLGRNSIVGSIPASIGELSNLRYLGLGVSSIVGSIPASIGELKSLTRLILRKNNLTGLVPSCIGELSNLMSLDISSNRLDGFLSEAHFANLSKLKKFDMSYNAALSLSSNWAWLPPFQLHSFKAGGCKLGPAFPKWLQTQKKLLELDISNNHISDTLGANFFNSFRKMFGLNLSHNGIKGNLPFSFPSPLFSYIDLSFNHFETSELHLYSGPALEYLDLSHNSISGPISVGTGHFQLEYLDLSHNNINGMIPLSFCQIKSLLVLDLSYNYLGGQIPGSWTSTSLIALKLSHNKLQGTIPNSLGTLSKLTSLHLDKNNLTGVIPPSLKYLSGLVMLDLGENNLLGEIPTWLGQSLSSLEVLRLRSNKFYGKIPRSLSHLRSLKVLDLACNRLSGTLSLSFNNFSAMVTVTNSSESHSRYMIFMSNYESFFEESISLVPKGTELEYTSVLLFVTMIDLSNNGLSGNIPEDITSLCGLRFLNLSWNHLKGSIPTDVSRMQLLESLDLSFNQLSGNIPLSVSTMLSLNRFNVSYNNLFGRIPSGPQLQTFGPSTYIGNRHLCGYPLLQLCPSDVTSQDPISQPSKEHEDKHEPYVIWLYIGMGTGFGAGFWGFYGGLLLMEKKRRMYFHFIDHMADELYVMVVIHFARLKLKISSWVFK